MLLVRTARLGQHCMSCSVSLSDGSQTTVYPEDSVSVIDDNLFTSCAADLLFEDNFFDGLC